MMAGFASNPPSMTSPLQTRSLFRTALRVLPFFLLPAVAHAQDAMQLMNTLVEHETEAGKARGHYSYLSEERSDRTGGHLWVERTVETQWGKVRFLVTEDGHPLDAQREGAERGRLAQIVADPEAFKRAEAARVDDEQHAKQMLTLLPKAFLFDGPHQEGDVLKVYFHPNPAYQPQGMEEKVLHGMSGTVQIDSKTVRLRGIEGHMPTDVSLGFGLLATIKAGSNFSTQRVPEVPPDWKTLSVHTDINGKALFLKTIARSGDSKRSNYKKIPDNLSIQDAVAMAEQ